MALALLLKRVQQLLGIFFALYGILMTALLKPG